MKISVVLAVLFISKSLAVDVPKSFLRQPDNERNLLSLCPTTVAADIQADLAAMPTSNDDVAAAVASADALLEASKSLSLTDIDAGDSKGALKELLNALTQSGGLASLEAIRSEGEVNTQIFNFLVQLLQSLETLIIQGIMLFFNAIEVVLRYILQGIALVFGLIIAVLGFIEDGLVLITEIIFDFLIAVVLFFQSLWQALVAFIRGILNRTTARNVECSFSQMIASVPDLITSFAAVVESV